MTQAGVAPEQIDHVDLYTCFPIAAQASAREFGPPPPPPALERPTVVAHVSAARQNLSADPASCACVECVQGCDRMTARR